MKTFRDLHQKTRPWFEMRRGRICSSDVCDFVDGDGTLKTAQGGKAVKTYVAKLVSERVSGHMDISGFMSRAMQYGSDHEDAARSALSLATGFDFEVVGGFMSDCGRWWASSDGACFSGPMGAVMAVAEIKIPIPKTQVGYLLHELRFVDEYKPQLCHEMLVTGAQVGYLFAYGAGFQCSRANVLVEVPAEDPFIENLSASLERIDQMVTEAMERIGASGGLADPDAGSEVMAWLGLSEEPGYAL